MKTKIRKEMKTAAGEEVTIHERLYESEQSRAVGMFFVAAYMYASNFFRSLEQAEEFARQKFDIQ